MFVIYCVYNRKSNARGFEFNGSFTDDSIVGSQVADSPASGPSACFADRRYLPRVNPLNFFENRRSQFGSDGINEM
ncbi:unnamed protein product [Gongylonema pulchrum]|uniref:Uncharacterized protein n=1 Tax=Gongylonema pulchrum TaxID=637853 RepID=A0A183DXR6_9BILA|nr:unnamed protein product [Gongylonema pulchrum]